MFIGVMQKGKMLCSLNLSQDAVVLLLSCVSLGGGLGGRAVHAHTARRKLAPVLRSKPIFGNNL